MAGPKDLWDKVDILAKLIVPVAVGAMLLTWNNQRTTQQTGATMTQIAVGILSVEPKAGDEPLREWAISVLREPSNPPVLSDAAAFRLSSTVLPWGSPVSGKILSIQDMKTSVDTEEFLRRMLEDL